MFESNELNRLPSSPSALHLRSGCSWCGPAGSAAEMLYVRYVLSAAAIQRVNEMSRSVYFPWLCKRRSRRHECESPGLGRCSRRLDWQCKPEVASPCELKNLLCLSLCTLRLPFAVWRERSGDLLVTACAREWRWSTLEGPPLTTGASSCRLLLDFSFPKCQVPPLHTFVSRRRHRENPLFCSRKWACQMVCALPSLMNFAIGKRAADVAWLGK